MSLINLLPHRAAAKKLRQSRFNRQLGYCVLLGFLLALGINFFFQEKIALQRQNNLALQAQATLLENKIKEATALQKGIQILQIRQHAVEDLQLDRNIPVDVMTELVKQLPEGVYVTSLRLDKAMVTLQGVSPSTEKVAEFLQNMGADSKWFTRPELLEVVAASVNLAPFGLRKVANFSVRLHLKRATLTDSASPSTPATSRQNSS
jgi:type IV pilus assembly protein PilN